MCARHVAVRFFGAIDELIGALFVDHAGDPFEADQQIAKRFHAVAVGDPPRKLRRDERDHDEIIGRERSTFLAEFEDVVGQQGADLVAGERIPFAVVGHRQRSRAADAIAVGIGGERQICAHVLGVGDDRVEDVPGSRDSKHSPAHSENRRPVSRAGRRLRHL